MTQPLAPDEIEYRYEESRTQYTIREYREGTPQVAIYHGHLSARPAWLLTILDVAKAGGYYQPIAFPPPDAILWFVTDHQRNLLRMEALRAT